MRRPNSKSKELPISENGADTDDALTTSTTGINVFGASPITGTLIVENVITDQDDDVVVKTAGT